MFYFTPRNKFIRNCKKAIKIHIPEKEFIAMDGMHFRSAER